MQVFSTKYKIGRTSWKERTPFVLKFFCDFLLFTSLVISSLWPDIDWALKVGVFLKLLSNFVSEHIPEAVQQEIKDNPIEKVEP